MVIPAAVGHSRACSWTDNFVVAYKIYILYKKASFDSICENMEILNNIGYCILKGAVDCIGGLAGVTSLNKEIKERAARRERRAKQIFKRRGTISISLRKELVKAKQQNIYRQITYRILVNIAIFMCTLLFGKYILIPLVELILSFFVEPHIYRNVAFVFHLVLTLISCLCSKLITAIWFQDGVMDAYARKRRMPLSSESIGASISDWIFSYTIEIVFFLQMSLSKRIPIIGYQLYFIQGCILYSLYSFQYSLSNAGLVLHKRLQYIETNWPYFVGFGLPVFLLAEKFGSTSMSLLEYSTNNGVYEPLVRFLESQFNECFISITFPLWLVSCNEAKPLGNSTAISIRFFKVVAYLSHYILRIFYFIFIKRKNIK